MRFGRAIILWALLLAVPAYFTVGPALALPKLSSTVALALSAVLICGLIGGLFLIRTRPVGQMGLAAIGLSVMLDSTEFIAPGLGAFVWVKVGSVIALVAAAVLFIVDARASRVPLGQSAG